MRGFGHAVGLDDRRTEALSRACITRGGSDALHDLMKRRRSVPDGRREVGSAARASSSWCSVGTAEYHVTP
jgi:hypothetical protein